MSGTAGILERTWALRRFLPDRMRRGIRQRLGVPDHEITLRLMRRNGFDPATVVDVGAYRGEWSRLCKAIFPEGKILMVEPQVSRQRALSEVARELPGAEVAPPVLLGPEERDSVPFYELESASSVLREAAKETEPSSRLPMTTLDRLVEGSAFENPDFLKVDVQGYELEVLKGARRSLDRVEAILMEVNLLPVYVGAPLFHEVASAMGEWGFQVYDICGLFRRPWDGAVWQMDAVFVSRESPLVAEARWQ